MRKVLCILALISHVLAQAPTQAERDAILKAHRCVRENVQPTASNMEMMGYSMSLEKLAIDWVQRCLLERPNPNLYPQYRGTGQAISVVVDDNPNLVDIVQGWYEEGKNYVFKNNTCEGICDDYIQMVWAKSTKLGCAVTCCDQTIPPRRKPVHIIACFYRRGAKWPDRKPYKAGPSCSRCPSGYECYRNQCVMNSDPEIAEPCDDDELER
uniref:SCP domain-containing protein n=1 Tax=Mesocestoides corti TaxID=53468 RepID=A0A5K3FRN8_MESCO